jgi:hypothetical protein
MGKRTGGVVLAILIMIYGAPGEAAELEDLFERVFGEAVILDPEIHRQVREGEPGKRHYIDRNGDGRPNEVWFIDTDSRHPEDMRPVLVRVIDEDGNLEYGHEPDLVNDLYIADWKADGTVNSVLDYTDLTGNGEVDEVAMYFGSYRRTQEAELMVWWGRDIGGDNLLWFDVGYGYRQRECQFRSHFGGNEIFAAFTLGKDDAFWVPRWENPFAFYDHDGDTATEEVVRIEAENYEVYNLRHSFDVNNSNSAEEPRSFDVSLSAHAPDAPSESILMTPGFLEGRGEGGMRFEPALGAYYTLRGIPTGPILDYDAAPGFALSAVWADQLLTWDENDLNIDAAKGPDGRFLDTQERWEGIIPPGTEGFHQIGGPHCGHYNKRYELRTTPGQIRVYFSPVDHRVHLHGVDRAWLIVDYDYDDQPDARYDYLDTNGDGYIDQWQFDANGDGVVDDTWTADGAPYIDLPYTWSALHAAVRPVLDRGLDDLFTLVNALRYALNHYGVEEADPIDRFVRSGFDSPLLDADLRQRLIGSRQTWFYYLDVLKDRLIVRLKQARSGADYWAAFDALRASGDYDVLRCHILESVPGDAPDEASLSALQEALIASFARPRVAWAQDWVPPNIGWESERVGYRAYWGQFDFFGKQQHALVMSTFGEEVNYHEEQDWGMDALHVGQTGGLGGITLYVNGDRYPVYSPEGKGGIVWSKRLVAIDDNRVTVELLAENVGPAEAPYRVTFTCMALADRADSPIEVVVEGGPESVDLALGIGITRMPQESFAIDTAHGTMGSWGVQDYKIGWIGLGIVFPPKRYLRLIDTPDEHQVLLEIKVGEPIRYHIQGDWLKGRRFPRSPVLRNWMEALRDTAIIAAPGI